MPDLLAGTTILAQDFPPSVEGRQAATISHNTSAMEPTDPKCEMTFAAGTTGRGMIHMFIRASVGTGDSDNINASVQVREDDANGAAFNSPTEAAEGIDWIPPLTLNQNQPGWLRLSGLTPGQTYHAEMVIDTDGDAISILEQVIVWQPLS